MQNITNELSLEYPVEINIPVHEFVKYLSAFLRYKYTLAQDVDAHNQHILYLFTHSYTFV